MWLIGERTSTGSGRWGGAGRNGMVIVASQRLEPERPWSSSGEEIRDGKEYAEGSNRQGKGRVSILPWSLVTQASAPSMQETFYQSPETKGPFPWHSLCDGSTARSRMRDQHQSLGGDGQEATAVAWQGDR